MSAKPKAPEGLFEDEAESGVQLAPVADLAAWAAKGKKKTAPKPKGERGIATASLKRATSELDDMLGKDNFTGARPVHFLVLFLQCHERVYGVPMELSPKERKNACFIIARLLKQKCEGDPNAFVRFVKWTWEREVAREQWRREHAGGRGGKLTIGHAHSNHIWTEYCVEMARKHHAKK